MAAWDLQEIDQTQCPGARESWADNQPFMFTQLLPGSLGLLKPETFSFTPEFLLKCLLCACIPRRLKMRTLPHSDLLLPLLPKPNWNKPFLSSLNPEKLPLDLPGARLRGTSSWLCTQVLPHSGSGLRPLREEVQPSMR